MQKITFISALSLYFDFISKSFTIFVNWKRVYCYILCDILALQRGETKMRFINYIIYVYEKITFFDDTSCVSVCSWL